MKKMSYKGFEGTIEFSKEDNCYFGQLINIRGLVSYEGDTIEDLEKDFKAAVDNHIELRKKLKIKDSSK